MAILVHWAGEDTGTRGCGGGEENASFGKDEQKDRGFGMGKGESDSGIRKFSDNIFMRIFIWYFQAQIIRRQLAQRKAYSRM